MISGRQTLGSIDQALQRVRAQIRDLDAEIQGTSTQLLQLRQQESAQYQALARLRLDQLAAGEMAAKLDRAGRWVGELLQTRQQTLQGLLEQIEEVQQQQAALEAERAVQAQRVDAAEEAIDTAEAAIQQQLGDDSTYQAQLQRAQQAEQVAQHAEKKTELAAQDRLDKSKPYESDRLFMYLWQRGYGTPRYQAAPPIRLLDGWVARLCGYRNARPNYAMLRELPQRMQEHAERVRQEADAQFKALRDLEQAATDSEEIAVLRRRADEAQSRLDTLDGELAQLEQQFQSLLQERAVFAAGEDAQYRQAVEQVSAEFEQANIGTLRREAQLTPTPDDDAIVAALDQIERTKEQLDEALEQYQRTLRGHQQQLSELESVRREFKRRRYDNVHSGFVDGALVTTMLNEFLSGVLSSDKLWGTLQRQQRTRRVRSDPDFGSGGFRRPGSVWRSGGLEDLFGGDRRGGFGGGGFRTGGSMGGDGGFRTGGSMGDDGGFRTGGGF